jgi:hypothetical protein
MEDCCKRGQTFIDKKAANIQGSKPKYFISLTDACEPNDELICFVINSENKMYNLREACNKEKRKYVLKPKDLTFIEHYSSIMLDMPSRYYLKELFGKDCDRLDVADELLCRQIKNCIDFNAIPSKYGDLIKACFKQSKKQ